jgi:methylated-DNA-[protein]-cysteine S-methyltransferase
VTVLEWSCVETPIGDIGVAVDDVGVCNVRFGPPPPSRSLSDAPLLSVATGQISQFFAGERTEFDLPVSVRVGSTFERAVWGQIAAIDYAGMRTYGDIAHALGDPSAARAVGTACNHNPLPIIVPCHRVVGAGGKLVGFGGGLPRKVFLLELEARVGIERAFG